MCNTTFMLVVSVAVVKWWYTGLSGLQLHEENIVVQLKLVTSGCGCSDPLVGPKRTHGMRHKREQFLVVPQTLTAGQDGASTHLQYMGQVNPQHPHSKQNKLNGEVTVVLVEGLEGGDVRRSFHDLIHPFYGPHHLVSFCLSEDWWTFVLRNLTLKTKQADTFVKTDHGRYRNTGSSSHTINNPASYSPAIAPHPDSSPPLLGTARRST
ncbi:hypothetical protein EYF80_017130 [Liparis tanakae]|uniref:Uncharacterized protein n=1 Tax=Liparis tanakae TaxID=230148 RepID=A0A4Z2I4I5_9TELE|nr:hypothetical protein EYF80_017130 [Liparis tanakae]